MLFTEVTIYIHRCDSLKYILYFIHQYIVYTDGRLALLVDIVMKYIYVRI